MSGQPSSGPSAPSGGQQNPTTKKDDSTTKKDDIQAIKDITGSTITLLQDAGAQNTKAMQAMVVGVIGLIAATSVLGGIGAAVGLVAGLVGALTQQGPDEIQQVSQKILGLIQQFEQGVNQDFLNQRSADIQEQVSHAKTVAQSVDYLKSHPLPDPNALRLLNEVQLTINSLAPPDVSKLGGGAGLWSVPPIYQISWDDSASSDVRYGVRKEHSNGYGKQSPPADLNGQVFNYAYVLPAYLYGISVFLSIGPMIDPDFRKNWSDTLLKPTASLLLSIHEYIVNSGLTELSPGPCTAQSLSNWFFLLQVEVQSGAIERHQGVLPLVQPGLGLFPLDVGGVTIEYGTVERFSGYSSVGLYTILPSDPKNQSSYSPNLNYNGKFQIRLLKRKKDVYVGAGLLTLWQAINHLNRINGDPPVSGPTPADWSLREIIKASQFPADPVTNKFSLYALATFIKHTPPLDTDQRTFVTSFRELISH